MAGSGTRILGIDPGSQWTGFALVDFFGQRFVHVQSGYLKLGRGDMTERLGTIYREIDKLIAQYTPEQAAVESVFVQKNVSSAIKLGQARGAAIAAMACQDLPVAEYPPAKVKQSICGGGRADKAQVNFMVQKLLSIHEPLQEDQADALAIAICHGFHLGPSARHGLRA